MSKVLTNLLMKSSTVILGDEADFPGSPSLGQFCFKGGVLYLYATISSVETWYPLTNKNQHYVYTQGISATTWVISHGLQTEDVIFVAYDESDVQMIPSSVTIDSENQITLSFLSGEKGKCVVFGASEQFAPSVSTGVLNVGDNITIEGTSITVSGIDIVALLDQTQTDLNAMFSWNGTQGEITFKGDLLPENTNTLNIGSETKKIKDLYLSAATLHIGDNATFEGTSLSIDAGLSPTSLAETPTIQASNITLKPFTYNPGGGDIETRPVFQFQVGGQNYPISFDTVNNKFSFDAQGNVGEGVIACKDIGASGEISADSIRTTGTAEVRFDQGLRVDGDMSLGYDDNNTIAVKGILDVQTPITFGEQATLGDGNDTIAVNCGAANDFTIVAQNASLDAAGKLTAAEIESSGNMTVQGNLFVNGTQTTVDTATLQVEDNEVLLNRNQTGDGITAGSGGIAIERGTLPNAKLSFNEATDKWQAGIEGSMTDLSFGNHDHDSDYLRTDADSQPSTDNVHSLGSGGSRFSDIYGTNIHGELDGNASTATALATARNITLSGGVTGTVSFDGTGDAGINATVTNDSHSHDTQYYTETEQDTMFLRKNATSLPSTDVTFDIGDATHRFAQIFAQTFKGNAETASKLNNARDITLTGDITGTASFDGSANISIATTSAAGGDADTVDSLHGADLLRSNVDTNFSGQTFSLDNGSGHRIEIKPSHGNIEIARTGGGAFIDFKNLDYEDYDVKLAQGGTGQVLNITGSGGLGELQVEGNTVYHAGNAADALKPASLWYNSGATEVLQTHSVGFKVVATSPSGFQIQEGDGKKAIAIHEDGPVDLFKNGVKTAYTNDWGISVIHETVPTFALNKNGTDTAYLWTDVSGHFKHDLETNGATYLLGSKSAAGVTRSMIHANPDYGVALYNAGVNTFEVAGSSAILYGDRPITFSSGGGKITIKGSTGGWAEGIFFNGSSGTERGQIGALGSADTLTYLYMGKSHTDNGLRVYPDGPAVLYHDGVEQLTTTSDGISAKASDHGSGTTPQIGNIVYGTGSPPSASSTPIGTIFVKYIN